MANVLIYQNNEVEHVKSVNTPEYSDLPNVIINPTKDDLLLIKNIGPKYLRIINGVLEELNQEEKDLLDKSERDKRVNIAINFNSGDLKHIIAALVKVFNKRLPTDNKITLDELKDQIRQEL